MYINVNDFATFPLTPPTPSVWLTPVRTSCKLNTDIYDELASRHEVFIDLINVSST